MNPKEQFIVRLKRNEGKFSASDRKIADYLVHSYPGGLFQTAVAMSETLGVSVSTITRFFPKIEFESIRQAQETFRKQLDFLKNSPLDRYHQKGLELATGDNLFDQAWDLDVSNIQRTYQGLSQDDIQYLVDLLSSKRNSTIYIFGERKTFALSFYMYVQLNAIHPNVVHVTTDQSLIADIMLKVRPGDVAIVFDFRRYLKANVKLAEFFKSVGGKVVVIGDSPISFSAKLADIFFLVESKGVSVFDSYTAGFTLINSLLAIITQHNGETVRKRYESLEKLYSHFDIFSSKHQNTNINRLPAPEEPENEHDS